MGFVAVSTPEAQALIESFTSPARLAVFVGSGVSAESGLPPWHEFTLRLLKRAFAEAFSGSDEERDEWAAQILQSQNVTGAAAVVRAFAPSDEAFTGWIVDELYGGESPDSFQAGPIAISLAELRHEVGDGMVIATTNYDDLLEKALRSVGYRASDVRPYIRRRAQMAPGSVPVMHLHGYAAGDGVKGRIVLSEEEYTRMQSGARPWQEDYAVELLREGPCLFVGTSLLDPNLIRYLYGYGQRSKRHWAVFVRQSEPAASEKVARARERALAARWLRCGVQTLFVDHFADVAQLVHEIRLARIVRRGGLPYVSAAERARRWITDFETAIVGSADREAFDRGQQALSDLLGELLRGALEFAADQGADLRDEHLGASVWTCDADGGSLVEWSSSHELHREKHLVRRVAIVPDGSWAAAQAYCRGTAVQVDLPGGSPWGCSLAAPFHLAAPSGTVDRLPVGAVQINSTATLEQTALARPAPADGGRQKLGDRMLAVVAAGVARGLTLAANDGPDLVTADDGGILGP